MALAAQPQQQLAPALVTSSAQPALDPSVLPSGIDSSLTLQVCTPSEYEQTWRLNAAEWRGFLSTPDFLAREFILARADLVRDGRATGWILTSPSLPLSPDGSRPILAACETLLKTAYVAKSGQLAQIRSHGIGSVFCRPEYRGHGYAKRMMQLLGDHLQTWQQEQNQKGTFSVLYSDIGKQFYAKRGWKAMPSTHIILPPLSTQQYNDLATSHERVTDLDRLHLSVFNTVHALREKLEELSQKAPSKTFVAFQPDFEHFDWHFMREEFLANNIGREFPQVKGALHEETGVAIIWNRVYATEAKDWCLNVLYTHIPETSSLQLSHGGSENGAPIFTSGIKQANGESSSETKNENIEKALAALLLRAQHEAALWDMAVGVEVWDPQPIVVAAAQRLRKEGDKVEVIHRDHEHICSLKWDGEGPIEDVVWIANESFTWTGN